MLLFLFLFFAFPALAAPSAAQEVPPNVVIIFADDLGYGDLGVYGNPTIRTPRLDRMAAEGVKFTQFYSAASVCTPSRAGLLTGRLPVRSGMVSSRRRVLFPDSRLGLPPEEITLAEALRERGYATAAIGKWHLGHLPEFLPTRHGFDSYFGIPYSNDMDRVGGPEGRAAFLDPRTEYWNVPLMRDGEIVERPTDQHTITRRYTEEALDFIREHRDGPFFLYLAHNLPHVPLFVSADFTDGSPRGLYGNVIEEIDWSVGRILDTLRELGLDERTLVFFTSDNGPWLSYGVQGGSAGLLRGGKGMTWEGGMRVPAIAWWPGSVPAGEVRTQVTSTLDLFPTALAMAGAAPPTDRVIDGRNLLPLLRGKSDAEVRDLFVYYRGEEIYAARMGPWKAHFVTQWAYPDSGRTEPTVPELYNLDEDPEERFDLSAEHPEVIARIRRAVEEHERGVVRVPTRLEARIDTTSVGQSAPPTASREALPSGGVTSGGGAVRPAAVFARTNGQPLSLQLSRGRAMGASSGRPDAFAVAAGNARDANEALVRSDRLMRAWLERADPATGLLPRNLMTDSDIWNARDAAADLFPFLLLTAWFTDRDLFEGRMQNILLTETALTSRVGRLADTYSFSKGGFEREEVDLAEVQFGSAEYMKDGLLPIVEWLGPGPWLSRMLGLLDDSWRYAAVETPYGPIPSDNVEVNGDELQVLNRMYWVTGDERYLDYAQRLGDYYLLGNHPTRDFERLRLRDHGNEIVSGLVELYATLSHARPQKAAEYRPHVHAMLDRILEVGRNEDGLFYNVIDPWTGEAVDSGIADNFGYILNGFYTVHLLDGRAEYRDAVLRGLAALEPEYRGFDWESGSADGDADAVEGALNLYNREPLAAVADWIDYQIRWMWSKQDSAHRESALPFKGSGIVEGWHGDGNFSRTSLMYALWKTRGTSAHPWRDDLLLGAVREGDELYLTLSASQPWAGEIRFDAPRHRTHLGLPLDWPRMNQFPEWFVVDADGEYLVEDVSRGTRFVRTGQELLDGLAVEVGAGEEGRWRVTDVKR